MLAQRIVADPALDGAARLALFQSCHALARMVLQHGHGSKELSVEPVRGRKGWRTLARLLGTKWQPVLGGLQLHVNGTTDDAGECPRLPRCPPAAIAQRVSHLRLSECALSAATLATWRLHDTNLWPQLQHLTLTECRWSQPQRRAGGGGGAQPSIPRLLSFAWTDTTSGADHSHAADALLALAAHATTAHVGLQHRPARTTEAVVRRLQRLTRLHLNGRRDRAVVEALLQHPALRHLALGGPGFPTGDLSQQPCQWRTLTLLDGAFLGQLEPLPLGSLKHITIHGQLYGYGSSAPAGLALLRRLHGEGRLVLAPGSHAERMRREWQLPPDAGPFHLHGEPEVLRDLVALMLGAGQGVDTLVFGHSGLPLRCLREEVAPMLQQHAGKVSTLCFGSIGSREWHRGVLGALPPCIRNVRIAVVGTDFSAWICGPWDCLRALVEGGVASVRHPLMVTLLCDRQSLPAASDVALRQLLVSGQVQHGLSLEVLSM